MKEVLARYWLICHQVHTEQKEAATRQTQKEATAPETPDPG